MDGIKALLDDTVVVVSGEGHGATAGARGANGDKAGAENLKCPFHLCPCGRIPCLCPFAFLGSLFWVLKQNVASVAAISDRLPIFAIPVPISPRNPNLHCDKLALPWVSCDVWCHSSSGSCIWDEFSC